MGRLPKYKSVALHSRCEELNWKCTDPQNSVGERKKLLKLPRLDSIATCVFKIKYNSGLQEDTLLQISRYER